MPKDPLPRPARSFLSSCFADCLPCFHSDIPPSQNELTPPPQEYPAETVFTPPRILAHSLAPANVTPAYLISSENVSISVTDHGNFVNSPVPPFSPSLQSSPRLVNQHHLNDVQHHPPSDHPNDSTLQRLQFEPDERPGISPSEQGLRHCSHHSPGSHASTQGLLNHAHDFVIKDSVFINDSSDSTFMASLLKETIPGAEYDSSDRSTPPRCHPGTRTRIVERCQTFILTCEGCKKLRWVVGAAGVGKSAIMQSVAEDKLNVLSNIIVGATIFFSINGRQDGTKAITTIAYQLAVELVPYRLFVQDAVTRDPSLLRKSLSTQFDKFIVEPFIHHCLLVSPSRLLIIIDGLDECSDPLTQQELLGLISDFCITYPTSPLVWIVASRPEAHITSFFSQLTVAPAYEKEEISVDSEDAYRDVQRYLRDAFKEVQMAYAALRDLAQWPPESDFATIAEASGGLFAYASTVVKYISDITYGDPASQLDDILILIKRGSTNGIFGRDQPMAQLDALYAHIMSKIPAKAMINTRKLLLLCLEDSAWTGHCFLLHCNMLGISQSTAYGATHHIHSVAFVPGPAEATRDHFRLFHKSFSDYLKDFERSGFSPDTLAEAQQLRCQCVLRILQEAPDGVSFDKLTLVGGGGLLENAHRGTENISLSWPAVGEQENHKIRVDMYGLSIMELVPAVSEKQEAYWSLLSMRVLTSFNQLPYLFPWSAVRDFAFDEPYRPEFLEHGILKQVPLETLDYDKVPTFLSVYLCFKSPSVELSDHWNTSCEHSRRNQSASDGHYWSTTFVSVSKVGNKRPCQYCFRRFAHHFSTQLPGHPVTILAFTPTERLVELRIIDPDDGVSEWIYRFPHGERWVE